MTSQLKSKLPIQVVCGLIVHNNTLLLAQKPSQHRFANLWEFPGGKIEANESLQQTLVREIKEELELAIEPLTPPYMSLTHDYGDFQLEMTAIFARAATTATLNRNEHQSARFVSLTELETLQLVPADIEIAQKLIKDSASKTLPLIID